MAGIIGTAAVVLAAGAGAYALITRREEGDLDESRAGEGFDRDREDRDLRSDLDDDLGSEDLE